jgi:hypothetical protein
MNARQEWFGRPGGCHAAEVFSRDGRMLALGEDLAYFHAERSIFSPALELKHV